MTAKKQKKPELFDIGEFLEQHPDLFKASTRAEDQEFLFIAKREVFEGMSAQELYGLTDRECKQLRGAIWKADDPSNPDTNSIFKPLGILRADIVNNDYRLKNWVKDVRGR